MINPEAISLEVYVCLGTALAPKLIKLSLPLGSHLEQAVHASKLLDGEKISNYHFGIYGELKTLDTPLCDQDRVEIYTPLLIDPKTARALRVQKTRIGNIHEKRKWRVNLKK